MKKIAYILSIICAMTMQSCLDLEPKTQLAATNYSLPRSSTAGLPTSDGLMTVSMPIFARTCLPIAR